MVAWFEFFNSNPVLGTCIALPKTLNPRSPAAHNQHVGQNGAEVVRHGTPPFLERGFGVKVLSGFGSRG